MRGRTARRSASFSVSTLSDLETSSPDSALPSASSSVSLHRGRGKKSKRSVSVSHVPALQDDVENRENVRVVVRVRPPLEREIEVDGTFKGVLEVYDDNSILISEQLSNPSSPLYNASTHRFTFDHVFDENADQQQVYDSSAKASVQSVLSGYNATVFAYGQTGTGKTYTMEGSDFGSDDERLQGIIPRAVHTIFNHIQRTSHNTRFLVRASYLQIYNEVICDLLKPERSNLTIREDKRKGIFVESLSEWVVRSPREVFGLIQRGSRVRATGSTQMNELSSRSHALFIIIVEQQNDKGADNEDSGDGAEDRSASFKVGKLNLVDLAGSERVRKSHASGQRLVETKSINQSLSALGNVIAALTDPAGRRHIPYRDSKLTRILEDSLGGNCRTTMMAMASPAFSSFSETLSTLKFAHRAKSIRNKPVVNEDLTDKMLLKRYERELLRLRNELQQRSRNVVDTRKLLDVEEQRRRAEEDKMNAIMNMERLSQELLREKQTKQSLEARIRAMSSQMLGGSPKTTARGLNAAALAAAAGMTRGSANVTSTPEFKLAVQQEQARLQQDYDLKVAQYEAKRAQKMGANREQSDRFKELLLKQRDIMVQLTARLTERDQSILLLSEEIDTLEKRNRELEDQLDAKTAALIQLQRFNAEKGDLEEADQVLEAQPRRPQLSVHVAESGSSDLLGLPPAGEDDAARVVFDLPSPRSQSPMPEDAGNLLEEEEEEEAVVEAVPDRARSTGVLERRKPRRKDSPALGRILSAEMSEAASSHIHELLQVLDEKQEENDRLKQRLALMHARVESLEVAQREAQLQQADGAEVEAREQLEAENAALKQELAKLRGGQRPASSFEELEHRFQSRFDRLSQQSAAERSELNTHLREFKTRVSTLEAERSIHVKEKEALTVILDQRMKSLLTSMATELGKKPNSVPRAAWSRLKELEALVDASVAALRKSGGKATTGGKRKKGKPKPRSSKKE